MERGLGRYLEPHEIVHHKNENRGDNRRANLTLLGSQSEHASGHLRQKWAHDHEYRRRKVEGNERRRDPATGRYH
jgi:hypothetical protein